MATITDDLAKAVTEGFRQAQIDVVNQDLILSGTGDVTVTLADGSKKTGPSWPKLITAATAAGTSATAAKTSETNAANSASAANTSKNAAAGSASAAKTSETNAKTSETNAKTSETNAKTSETNAKTSETNAAASLAAAQQLTSVPYEDAPYPDVWAPLSDDLRLLAGSAPYDKLTISGQVLELPTKSMSFSRATAGTYVDKAGILQTAAVNEPRFEKDGLLVEGASTNQVLYSSDASNWSKGNITVTANNAMAPDGTLTANKITFATTSAVATSISANVQSAASFVTGGFITTSVFLKAAERSFVQLLWPGGATGVTNTYANFDLINGTATGTCQSFRIEALADGWFRCSATALIDGDMTASGLTLAWVGMINSLSDGRRIPFSGVVGEGLYPWGLQVEAQGNPTSYIPTTGATVTRSPDAAFLLAVNGGFDNVTISCTVTRQWQGTNVPNTAPRIFSTRISTATSAAWEGAFNGSGNANTFGGVTNASSAVAGFVDGQVFTSIKTPVGFTTVIPSGKKDGNQVVTPGMQSPLYLGNTKESDRPLFGHIRNLRIWHRVLTDNQIKGLR